MYITETSPLWHDNLTLYGYVKDYIVFALNILAITEP